MKRLRKGTSSVALTPSPDSIIDSDGLSLHARALLTALTTTLDFNDACQAAGISTHAGRMLFLTSTAFRAAYNELYGTARELVRRFNETLLPGAMSRLHLLIQSEDEDIALKAVRTVLQLAGEALDASSNRPIVNIVQIIQQLRAERGLPELFVSPAIDADYVEIQQPQPVL